MGETAGGVQLPGGQGWGEPPILSGPTFPEGDDQALLIWMLQQIQEQIRDAVFKAGLIPEDLVGDFQKNWPTIEGLITDAIEAIKNDWENLRGPLSEAGMTGDMAKLKAKVLQRCIEGGRKASPVYLSYPDLSRGLLSRVTRPILFKVMNSILGSLAKALPLLEPVMEYKDHVEAATELAGAEESG
jgi:hypothetical protein